MPGPRNTKAKRKVSIQKEKIKVARKVSVTSTVSSSDDSAGPPSDCDVAQTLAPQPRIVSPTHQHTIEASYEDELTQLEHNFSKAQLKEAPLLPEPCIHDPGNGPRVRDLVGFLKSPFSSTPSWDAVDCMEYHHQHVLDFLATLLPYEQAVILWYNKTREFGRICPACRRFYRLGDRLYSHPYEPHLGEKSEDLLGREQEQSGLCSFMCFGVAGYNFPGAISAWGMYDHELDDVTRDLLNGPGMGVDDDGFGMYLKLTRQDDPGYRNIISLCREEEELENQDSGSAGSS